MSTETRRILIVNGHPDIGARHLLHQLIDAYAGGAQAAGHQVRRVDVGALDFPLLRSAAEWEHGALPEGLKAAQDDIAWCQHLLLCFPLWLGDMPAMLKGFLEQLARPGFAFHREEQNPFGKKALGGRSARIVVTMGMPALLYRWYFRAHSVKSLERNILGFVGIAPVHETLVGLVDRLSEKGVAQWCAKLRKLGAQAA